MENLDNQKKRGIFAKKTEKAHDRSGGSVIFMKGTNRKCFKGILNHCYQRPRYGEVLFYSVSDYLVFFTLLCVAAKKHCIQVLSLTLMPDHVHHCTEADRKTDLSAFVRDYSAAYASEYNTLCHRKGQLFQTPFGSAPKLGDKKARSAIVYVGNNPTERKLCDKAEDYRWTFLTYAESRHPFSEKLVIHSARRVMRRAVAEVKAQHNSGRHLNYTLLQRLFKTLNRKEKEQLVDFIITTYSVIDTQAAIRFFGSYGDMLTAMHATSGSEHDLNEIFIGKSDAVYAKLTKVVMREMHLEDIHDLFALSQEERFDVMQMLRRKTDVPTEQIAKYLQLHIKFV